MVIFSSSPRPDETIVSRAIPGCKRPAQDFSWAGQRTRREMIELRPLEGGHLNGRTVERIVAGCVRVRSERRWKRGRRRHLLSKLCDFTGSDGVQLVQSTCEIGDLC